MEYFACRGGGGGIETSIIATTRSQPVECEIAKLNKRTRACPIEYIKTIVTVSKLENVNWVRAHKPHGQTLL